MTRRLRRAVPAAGLVTLLLAACSPADPASVARAVAGTLTAVPTQTPVVVVVTVIPPAGLPTATSAAVVGPAASETPASPEASPTAAPSETMPPSIEPTGRPTLGDDFSQPTGWTLAEDGLQKTALVAGRLEFTVKEPDQFRFLYDIRRRGRDFFARLTGGGAACQPRDRLGLLFRVQDGANYYQLEVDCAGHFRLAKVVDGELTPLRDWAASLAIRVGEGAANDLAVRAQGPALEAFINGTSVLQTSDPAFAEGAFGLIVGSGPSFGFTAVFDDFQVWELR
jgi:hypothetical protein